MTKLHWRSAVKYRKSGFASKAPRREQPRCDRCRGKGASLATCHAPALGGRVELCRRCLREAERRGWIVGAPATTQPNDTVNGPRTA